MTSRINPAVLPALNEALATLCWYKKDLRSFLNVSLDRDPIIGQIDWSETKRSVVDRLISEMSTRQHIYFEQLIDLTLSVAEVTDPFWLKRVEDGETKYQSAVENLDRLRLLTAPFRKMRTEQEEILRRERERMARAAANRAIEAELESLKGLLVETTAQNAQERGYSLERLLNRLFQLLDITSRPSFRNSGEQIDGAFSLTGHDFLLEAKWTSNKTGVAELDVFTGKVSRKLDNTLGLFMSMNGFQQSAVEAYSRNRSTIILMDGADLYAVLEARVDLTELLERKRRHAAQTGAVFFSASEMLTG